MTSPAHEPTPAPGTPRIATPPKAADVNGTRIPLSADPTQPIKLLRGKAVVSPATRQPVAELPVAKPPTAGAWLGDDQTLIEATVPSDQTPAEWVGNDETMVVMVEEEWKGDDRTVTTPVNLATSQFGDDPDWNGDDQTLVGGLPAMRGTSAAKPAAEWLGNEATQLGIPTGPGKTRAEGATSHGSRTPGSKPTSPTLEDAWHFKGRQGPLTGVTVGDYQMGGILGEGGMGTVYRARQLSLKRRAAVKVLPSNLAADLQLRARFEQEARTASLLNTAHVVQVFGAGTVDDIVYFAMEYVEGTDLSAIIHEKKEKGEFFTPEEAAGYVIQAARGLAEAAKHNIVHRDIKPANLMVTTKGVVKIADFGISKIAGETGMTMAGTAVGTPAYCSPEQGRGDEVDPRADLYSLGVVFYELLTGRKPFDGTTANALIYQHNYQEPVLPSTVMPGLPDAYQAVCMKCLMKDPAGRYGDAAELVSDLERVRDGNMSMTAVFQARFGTGADAAMAKYLGVNKRWWLKWAIAASFLVIVGGGGIYWSSTNAAVRQRQRDNDQREIAQHKDALRDLDAAKPIPRNAGDDLAWLAAKLPGDADLARWQLKVGRVAPLQKSLAVLDEPELPDQATHVRARLDLTAYADEVGKGADVQRWEARLGEADARITSLRSALAREIDPSETLSGPLRGRVQPGVVELTALAGDGDADVQRWTKRLATSEAEVAQQRTALAELDQNEVVLSEVRSTQLAGHLARLTALTDSQDADVQRWGVRLSGADQQLSSLRRTLAAELDRERLLTVAQQDAIRPYLERYRAQVDAGNPQLVAWTRRLDESAARVSALRKTLAATLDQPDALPSETALTELAATLKDYAVLVAPDDQQLATWAEVVRRQRAAIDGDRAVLVGLDKSASKQHLTVVTRTACEKALVRLDARGALAADRKGFYLRRLGEEKAYEDGLRADLKTREADQALATAEKTISLINDLEAIAGGQDADVKRWRDRLERFFTLRDALKPLNKPGALPAQAAENLTEFAKLASRNSTEVSQWKAKLVRVQQLTTALTGLDAVQPMPPGALANASELVEKWLGPDEPRARAWLIKARKVTDLRAKLDGLFTAKPGSSAPSNLVLPAAATPVRDVLELIALTGETQVEVRHWRYRAQMLNGPGRPAWATTYERDAYGPYAELVVAGVSQRMRWVPANTFALGSPANEVDREDDEPLIAEVTVTKGLWFADSETTQSLWTAIMGVNPSRFALAVDAADRPVERVSWNDTQEFLKSLASKIPSGEFPRLPTEAEWEYACRAGVASPFATYTGDVDPAQLDTIAWFGLLDGTRGVRRRAPNRFGLFDMHGNVWEWCQDKYGTYSAADTVDPLGRQEETRVARGGSWADPAKNLRAANRLAVRPDLRTLYVGFRFAIPALWPPGKEPQRPRAGDELSLR